MTSDRLSLGRVGVADPVPVFRRGLVVALAEAGFSSHEWDATTKQSAAWDAICVTVVEDVAWEPQLQPREGVTCTVALLRDATVDAYSRALRAGATGVAAWGAAPELIIEVVGAAIRGYTIVPADVALSTAERVVTESGPDLSQEELQWLCLLADGSTVGHVGSLFGRSERSMHRLLHRLYDRLGVANRSEAITKAARWGLVMEPSSGERGWTTASRRR